MVDLPWVKEHFSPTDSRLVGEGPLLADGLWDSVDLMLKHCPVVHSDGRWYGVPDGGYLVNRYSDVMDVIRDTEGFSNHVKKGDWADEPIEIPFDLDPPLLTEYRRVLQPHLTVKSVAKFEPVSRAIITDLIDGFIETGRCDDFVSRVSNPFSAKVQLGKLVGVDEGDHEQVLKWVSMFVNGHHDPGYEAAITDFLGWIRETITWRRTQPARDDLIQALFVTRIEDRLLSDDEVTRIMMSMIVGGVNATADAVSNTVFRLARYPELQARLREDLELLPTAIEEFLRIEPPATAPPRRCTRDTTISGVKIRAGEQLGLHLAAANRDPEVFENPTEVVLDRERSSHLTFGAGHHRCLGSNFARLNIRVALEEILTRLHDISLIQNDPPRRVASSQWGPAHLPITFTAA
jgi:cytochrome P450